MPQHVEPVVQVRAERPFGHVLAQRAVRRRDDAHVDRDRLRAADARDLALLEHAQELHLRGRRDLADLVEEERPRVGQLEAAEPALGRAR